MTENKNKKDYALGAQTVGSLVYTARINRKAENLLEINTRSFLMSFRAKLFLKRKN